jgi:hypothetical protein
MKTSHIVGTASFARLPYRRESGHTYYSVFVVDHFRTSAVILATRKEGVRLPI